MNKYYAKLAEDFSCFDGVGHDFNRRFYTSDIVDEVGDQLMFGSQTHRDGKLPAFDPLAKFEDQAMHFPELVDLVSLHRYWWPPDDFNDFSVYRNMHYRFSTRQSVEDEINIKKEKLHNEN